MNKSITTVLAALIGFGVLTGCDAPAPNANAVAQIPAVLYQGVNNLRTANTFGARCEGISVSNIAADRHIEDIIDGLIKRGVSVGRARTALRTIPDAQLEEEFRVYLQQNNVTDDASFCALARTEMANRSEIGKILVNR